MKPTLQEMEYFAGEEEIEIMPLFECTSIKLMSYDFGPFKTGVTSKVPLWVALNLRARNKCKVVLPAWMSKDNLRQLIAAEAQSFSFVPMPSEMYMAVAKTILKNCAQDIPDSDEVMKLVKTLCDLRMFKLEKGLTSFVRRRQVWTTVDKLIQLEMCAVRPYLISTLAHYYRIKAIENTCPH